MATLKFVFVYNFIQTYASGILKLDWITYIILRSRKITFQKKAGNPSTYNLELGTSKLISIENHISVAQLTKSNILHHLANRLRN